MKSAVVCILLAVATLASAQSFEVYVSDAGNFTSPPWQILKFDSDGKNPAVFISSNLNWPQDILFLEDSNTVLISSLGSGKITKHDATTGAYLGDFATGISGPTRIRIGPDNLLYVLQWTGNGRVRRYDLDGTPRGLFTSVGVPQSIGLDWDKDGNLYVSSYSGDFVQKFDASGNSAGLFVNSNLAGPTNIWFDENGDLLVNDYDGTAVKRFSAAGHYLGDFAQGLRMAEGHAYLPDGHLLVGDGGSRSVKRFDETGRFVGSFVASGTAGLLNPNAIVVRVIAPPAPDAPDQLMVSRTGPSVSLTWRDNSDGEDGFRIYRIVDRGERAVLATVEANVTSHVDGTLEPGHLYEYQVTAFAGKVESEVVGSVTVSVDCATPAIGVRGRPVRPGPRPCAR